VVEGVGWVHTDPEGRRTNAKLNLTRTKTGSQKDQQWGNDERRQGGRSKSSLNFQHKAENGNRRSDRFTPRQNRHHCMYPRQSVHTPGPQWEIRVQSDRNNQHPRVGTEGKGHGELKERQEDNKYGKKETEPRESKKTNFTLTVKKSSLIEQEVRGEDALWDPKLGLSTGKKRRGIDRSSTTS